MPANGETAAENPAAKGADLLTSWDAARLRGLTQRQHATELGMTFPAYKSRMARARQAELDKPWTAPQLPYSLGSPWRLRGDWMIVGDVHVPFTDPLFARRVIQVALKYLSPPRNLLIAGDFFNLDSMSLYEQVVTPPSWAQEREFAREMMCGWMQVFENVRMIMGNHDRRMQRYTAGAFEVTDILSLIVANPDRVALSNFGHCVIETPTGEWRVTHPRNYSINQLTVADTLAQKYQMHIISHHEHHVAMGWDRFKRYMLINNGTLVDQTKLAYTQLDDSKSAMMAQGFTVLRDGYPLVFGAEPFTDWRAFAD